MNPFTVSSIALRSRSVLSDYNMSCDDVSSKHFYELTCAAAYNFMVYMHKIADSKHNLRCFYTPDLVITGILTVETTLYNKCYNISQAACVHVLLNPLFMCDCNISLRSRVLISCHVLSLSLSLCTL